MLTELRVHLDGGSLFRKTLQQLSQMIMMTNLARMTLTMQLEEEEEE